MKKVVIILLMMGTLSAKGQQSFNGSFLMSFTSPKEIGDNPPMLWNIEQESKGGRMAMELQDEMQKKGVSKRVLFNPKDSTWTMLMSFNNVKQGARIHRADLFRNKKDEKKVKSVITNEKRIIEGYNCKKVIIESNKYKAEIWLTEELRFDICRIYKLLSHCSMMNEVFRSGDWYFWKSKGMILEVNSKIKSTSENYKVNIYDIKVNKTDPLLFNTSGFRISEIPEGQNCGITMEEK